MIELIDLLTLASYESGKSMVQIGGAVAGGGIAMMGVAMIFYQNKKKPPTPKELMTARITGAVLAIAGIVVAIYTTTMF